MSATRVKRTLPEDIVPPQQPLSLPQQSTGFHDHSFTLQAIMDLQKTMGELSVKLDTVKGSVDSVKAKVDDLTKLKHMIGGAAIAITAVVGIAWAVGTKAAEYWSKSSTQQSAPVFQQAPLPAAAPSHPGK